MWIMTLSHAEGCFTARAPPIYGGEKQGKVSWQGAECLYSVCTLPVYCLYRAKSPPNMDTGILTFERSPARSGLYKVTRDRRVCGFLWFAQLCRFLLARCGLVKAAMWAKPKLRIMDRNGK